MAQILDFLDRLITEAVHGPGGKERGVANALALAAQTKKSQEEAQYAGLDSRLERATKLNSLTTTGGKVEGSDWGLPGFTPGTPADKRAPTEYYDPKGNPQAEKVFGPTGRIPLKIAPVFAASVRAEEGRKAQDTRQEKTFTHSDTAQENRSLQRMREIAQRFTNAKLMMDAGQINKKQFAEFVEGLKQERADNAITNYTSRGPDGDKVVTPMRKIEGLRHGSFQAPVPDSAGERNAEATVEKLAGMLDSVAELYEPSFVGPMQGAARNYVAGASAPVQMAAGAVKTLTGGGIDVTSNAKFAMFKALNDTLVQVKSSDIGGKVITENEKKLILGVIGNPRADPQQIYEAKVRAAKLVASWMRQRVLTYRKEGNKALVSVPFPAKELAALGLNVQQPLNQGLPDSTGAVVPTRRPGDVAGPITPPALPPRTSSTTPPRTVTPPAVAPAAPAQPQPRVLPMAQPNEKKRQVKGADGVIHFLVLRNGQPVEVQ